MPTVRLVAVLLPCALVASSALAQGTSSSPTFDPFVVLLSGYESNARLTYESPATPEADVSGSAVISLEAGADLTSRSRSLDLRFTPWAMLRLPTISAKLTDAELQLPLLMRLPINALLDFDLRCFSEIVVGRASPVFLDRGTTTTRIGTQRHWAATTDIQPGLTVELHPTLSATVAPRLRFRTQRYTETPFDDESTFRYFAGGGAIAIAWEALSWLRVRVNYDVAHRIYDGIFARPVSYNPVSGRRLRATLHTAGTKARIRFGPGTTLSVQYAARLGDDNGGYLGYLDHILRARLRLAFGERFYFDGTLYFAARNYGKRTPCQAERLGADRVYRGSDCSGPTAAQVHVEHALRVSANATYYLWDWLGVVARYELEDAATDQVDPLAADHRLLGGVTFDL
ncbi:MAG: hypothetical protein H6707_10815 [Deltaproteobacteria bacterium]|nr:hypothetical protein [Deltaproteobacteria bacterium]